MTTNEILTLIFAGFSVVVSVFAYTEAYKMRNTSIRPVVIPADFELQLNGPYQPFLVFNIGNGPAKSVKTFWSYDQQVITDYLLKYQLSYLTDNIDEYYEVFVAKDKNFIIWLPESYEDLVNAERKKIEQVDRDKSFLIFPTLSLLVEYKDIFEKKYDATFEVKVNYMRDFTYQIKFFEVPKN